jgi:hypothetical protein
MPKSSGLIPRHKTGRQEGVALVIVLAFVVILTGVIIAYFTRSLANRQISNSSANQTKVALFAQGASDTIIANLQEEIVLSSSTTALTPATSGTLYTPLTPVSMLPQVSGSSNGTPFPPNLLKISTSTVPFFAANANNNASVSIPSGGQSNATKVATTTPSLNGRSVSLARWNAGYLLPLASSTDSTPITATTPSQNGAGNNSGEFVTPDWVLVARDGSNPAPSIVTSSNTWSATNTGTVIGRYAYAVYNEGGLLDVNVAGYPSTTNTNNQSSYKPVLSYADLTQVGLTQPQVDQLVAWRNYASAQTPGPSYQNPEFNGTNNGLGTAYYNFVTSNPSGFLTVSSTNLNNNGEMESTSSAQGSSDRMFGSRQELISFMQKGLNPALTGTGLGILNYLTTFTRGLAQPSFAPDPKRPKVIAGYTANANNGGNSAFGLDDQINPSFLTVRVSGTGFLRNDGSTAVPGEPLVKTRFALSKLAWITYLGPSANRVIPTTNPGVTNVNYDMWQLVNTYGVPASYLLQGTKTNIQKYFGLVWQPDTAPAGRSGGGAPNSFHDGEYKWFYSGHNESGQSPSGTTPADEANISGTSGSISRLADIASTTGTSAREPDFFELLKAAVAVGSKAKGSMSLSAILSAYKNDTLHPYAYQLKRDTNLDYAIIQLGANIIDQAKVDGYSTRIVFNDGVFVHEFRGVENLPYIYRVNSGTLKLRMEGTILTSASNDEEDSPPAATLKDTGVGLVMEIPTVWNPHDENAPLGAPAPAGPSAATIAASGSNFRLIADSIDPDDLVAVSTANPTNYTQFYGAGYENQDSSIANSTAAAAANTYTTGPNGAGAPITPALGAAAAAPPSGQYTLNPSDASLYFVVPNQLLFREPTPLAMAGLPANSNLQMGAPLAEFTQIQNSAGKAAYTASKGFLSDGINPLNLPSGGLGKSQSYVGICGALYPIEWPGPKVTSGTAGIYQSANAGFNYFGGGVGGQYITYRLQYRDPNTSSAAYSGSPTVDSGGASEWETYDEKYNFWDCLFLGTPFGSTPGNLTDSADGAQGGDWEGYVDPRTSRFAGINGVDFEGPVQTPGGTGVAQEWADQSNGISVTDRPDFNAGFPITNDRTVNGSVMGGQYVPLQATGWTFGEPYFHLGLLSQNSPTVKDNGVRFTGDSGKLSVGVQTPGTYYADPDGVVRGAMGVYNLVASANNTAGLPLTTAYNSNNNPMSSGNPNAGPPKVNGNYQGQSRPYMLHRPFRSVGELGYVFSGTPWKNIDFFTPESGDAALLDVFTAYETPAQTTNSNPLVAGVVNLNTQQPLVLQAILAGASVDEAQSSGTASTNFPAFSLSKQQWNNILPSGANGNTVLANVANNQMDEVPAQNVSELVGRWVASSGTYSGLSGDLTNTYASFPSLSGSSLETMQNVDRFREAFIRPLAAVGNTRVWNLMIDVIAQTGRYPQGTSDPRYFVVDGEQRYWVHVAIDRFTGQVLDKQVEVVKE